MDHIDKKRSVGEKGVFIRTLNSRFVASVELALTYERSLQQDNRHFHGFLPALLTSFRAQQLSFMPTPSDSFSLV